MFVIVFKQHGALNWGIASEPEPIEWIIQRGPETVEDGQCTLCGRDYSDNPKIRRCQSDDCPSHWEEVGLKREG